MRLTKVEQYGKHERDRPLREDELLWLRREITRAEDWKADGQTLHIGDGEILACNSEEQATLLALMRNALLQVLNDNVRLRHEFSELEQSYFRLTRAFKSLWERTNNGN